MAISFIVTTYNVAPYLPQCLNSLAEVALDGDQIILVDDGSTDDSAEILSHFAAHPPEGVDIQRILLGTNTIGGVGIGANIGLAEATRDTVFFVDGDDWIDADGFRRARAQWGAETHDIMFTNYLEFDDTAGRSKPPADQDRWMSLRHSADPVTQRQQALNFIAVPWRKFYRRDFIEAHNLRFPEGDFFFEDNPFHWAVCLHARRIGFLDIVTCHHRVNRPGQTMASTGTELTAFFTHFRSIQAMLAEDDVDLQTQAARWLLNNMSWHLGRLSGAARAPYAKTAAQTLMLIPDAIWRGSLQREMGDRAVYHAADRLRAGEIRDVIAGWEHAEVMSRLSRLEDRLRRIESGQERLAGDVRAMAASAAFAAIHGGTADR